MQPHINSITYAAFKNRSYIRSINEMVETMDLVSTLVRKVGNGLVKPSEIVFFLIKSRQDSEQKSE